MDTITNSMKIHGTITGATGQPLQTTVNIYQNGFRTRTLVISTTSNASGYYESSISAGVIQAENYITVAAMNGDVIAATSPGIYASSNDVTIDLSVTTEIATTPEFSRFATSISAATGDLTLSEISNNITTDDVRFIENATDVSSMNISTITSAHVYAEQANIQPEFMYALLRNTSFYDQDSVLSMSDADIRQTLQQSFDQGIIPTSLQTNVDATLSAIADYQVAKTKAVTIGNETATIGSTITCIFGGNTAQADSFLHSYRGFTGTSAPDFWASYKASAGTALAQKAQKGIQLAAIAGFQPDIITELLARTGEAPGTHDFAAYTESDWRDLIDSVSEATGRLCVPKAIAGDSTSINDDKAKSSYASVLKNTIQNLYPLITVKSKIQDPESGLIEDSAVRSQVVTFISNNPDFDVRVASIHDMTAEQCNLTGITDIEAVKKEIAPYQRLLRITGGKPEAVIAMKTNGIDSAQAIAKMSQDEFTSQYAGMFGSVDEAIAARETATNINAVTTTLTLGIKGDPSLGTSPVWPGRPTIDAETTPTLANLFGSAEMCACSDCKSVYSPSAYFVDIMNFLNKRSISSPATGNQPAIYGAYDELLRRRQDLQFIDLTCKNANTPLPYIDLVNEILEQEMINRTPKTGLESRWFSFQTSGAAEELAAAPEHKVRQDQVQLPQIPGQIIPRDYIDYWSPAFDKIYNETLKNAVFPASLPLNLPIEESRTYLKHMGISRFELMKQLRPLVPPTDLKDITDSNLYGEFLGLTKEEVDIICTSNPSNLGDYYGLPNATCYDLLAGKSAQGLEIVLEQTNVSYVELLQLLTTGFLNGDRLVKIVAKDGAAADTCVLSELWFNFASPAAGFSSPIFNKLFRFVRLWRATGLSIYEFDILCRGLNLTDFDYDAVISISKAIMTCKRLNISVAQGAALWNAIDTLHYAEYSDEGEIAIPSFYESLFQNKTLLNPPDTAFAEPSSLNLAINPQHSAAVLAASGILQADLTAIINKLGIATFTLDSIGRIYRIAVLSQSLRISVTDLLRLLDFTGLVQMSGSGAEKLSQIIYLCDKTDDILSGKMSFDELDFLINNKDRSGAFIPPQKNIQLFYEALRKDLKKAATDSATDANNKAVSPTNIVFQHFVSEFGISSETTNYLLTTLLKISINSVPAAAMTALQEESFIKGDYNLDISTIGTLATGTTTFNLVELYTLYYRISKIALIANRYGFNYQLLKKFQDLSTALTTPDFTVLPVNSESPSASATLYSFLNLDKWVRVANTIKLAQDSFLALLDAAGASDDITWKQILSTVVGWDTDSLTYITGSNVLSFDATQSHKPEVILAIAQIFASMHRLGLSITQLKTQLRADLTLTDAHTALNAAKAKHDETSWLTVAKPLQDTLRERKREALVAWLLANPDTSNPNNKKIWSDENDLYAHFLIDVEMKPLTMTSRLKQAIGSVQIFIDRVQMNLEYQNYDNQKLISLSEESIKEWKTWRKWYRIWEANRKIFLYPENWIEPELRDDKTPFFKELETELLQDEVTADKVEDVVHSYLEKLDEVARLEPVTAFHQYEAKTATTDEVDIVHVIARTYAEPHNYFYRRLENDEWSPWEKINSSIKSDHVVAVVWNRRLHLFWLTFTEKVMTDDEKNRIDGAHYTRIRDRYTSNYWLDYLLPKNTTSDNLPIRGNADNFPPNHDPNNLYDTRGIWYTNDAAGNRYKYFNVMLNWTEYKDGKWLSPKVSKDEMQLAPYKFQIAPRFQSTYSNATTVNDIYNTLSKNKEIGIDEVFKNKLYLTPFVNSENTLVLFMNFAPGLDETNEAFHSFRFEDSSTDPVVVRDNFYGYFFMAPPNTLTNKMKFIESPITEAGGDNKLRLDTYNSVNGVSYYGYNTDSFTGNSYPTFARGNTSVLLNKTPFGNFVITSKTPDNGALGDVNYPSLRRPMDNHFFFDDKKNLFFARQTGAFSDSSILANVDNVDLGNWLGLFGNTYGSGAFSGSSGVTAIVTPDVYKFQTFYHPQIHNFIHAVNKDGLDALYKIDMQVQDDTMNFNGNYSPTAMIDSKYPTNIVEFTTGGTYSQYNWELFFHIPMMVAQSLSNNQQFEDAQKWFHKIFDPTSTTNKDGNFSSSKNRFWKFRPFYDQANNITTVTQAVLQAQYYQQIAKWQENPFMPHLIARMRQSAYMKNVLMKYIDNLIAWGDQLFRRNTLESINEATLIYVLASNILGKRPQEIPPRAVTANQDLLELQNDTLDEFSNAMVEIESFIDPNSWPVSKGGKNTIEVPEMAYFCLPENDKLLAYWDTVADRLFKIRNSMNIDGVFQQLPIYEPPIDPALLVRAAAAGLDINSVLDSVNGLSRPYYRFNYVLQKANELCNEVRGLGSLLLSALEKKDAEALALLRSGHELKLLEKVRDVKEAQVNEADESLQALQKTREITQARYTYYSTRPFMNAGETQHLQSLQTGLILQAIQGNMESTASSLSAIPQFHAQATQAVGTSFGGQQLSAIQHALASNIGILSSINSTKGAMAQTQAGYQRRQDDWTFQADTAAKELEQIDLQILAAEIRLDIAQRELSNHELQMTNTSEADEFMRNKFTNQELYNWMTGQIASTFFQSYQLAYDLAKKTEQCYDYELPGAKTKKPASGFITFGYWDSLRKGLLAGEKLQYDLHKMEVSYMEQNKREFELTKHVSLALTNPQQLLQLRSTGTCNMNISEELFDIDYPGHYRRRIKSVSLSIPCVAGPYTTVACKLLLNSNKYRNTATGGASYPYNGTNDTRFNRSIGGQAIATSTAQNDSGLFEFNFRDERYLPFEGEGAISDWTIELPDVYRQFDYNTISDVILHIRYTAVEDGTLKDDATAHLDSILKNTNQLMPRYFSLKHEFSNEWNQYSQAKESNTANATLNLKLTREMFPYFCKGKDINITGWYLKPRFGSCTYDLMVNDTANGIKNKYLLDGADATINLTTPIKVPASGRNMNLDIDILSSVGFDVLKDFYLVAFYKLSDSTDVCPGSTGTGGNQIETFTTGIYGGSGSVLAPNGKLYIPQGYKINELMVVNPADNSSYMINLPWQVYCAGGCLAPNGKIYFPIANGPAQVLVVDTADDSFATFGPAPSYYGGACLAPNGKIYCPPVTSGNILVIDPATNTMTTINGVSNGYFGACLAPNGNIYCVPYNTNSIAVIDPTTNNVRYISVGTNLSACWSGVLAQNGKIYCNPRVANYPILVIDTTTETTYNLATNVSGFLGVASGIGPDGTAYFFTNNDNVAKIVTVNTNTDVVSNIDTPIINLRSGKLAFNGRLYVTAWYADAGRVMTIPTGGQVTSDMLTMPDDLTTLAASKYNIYQNHL